CSTWCTLGWLAGPGWSRWRWPGWVGSARRRWRWSTAIGTPTTTGWCGICGRGRPPSLPRSWPSWPRRWVSMRGAMRGGRGPAGAAVHAELARLDGRWLLVFDNAETHAAVRRFLPAAGTGHVVVTTQDGMWPQAERIDVPGLDDVAAARLLLDAAGESDAGLAARVARALGLLPLALAQAAAFVTTTGRSLAEFEQLLNARTRD